MPTQLAPWKQLSTRQVYTNPWISVREDIVELPDGKTTLYGVVRSGECAGVLPFKDPETVILVRQFRYVTGRHTWEMPTGGMHKDETVLECAQRELAEEIGFRAGRLEPLTTIHTSKSILDETAYLFAARDLSPANGRRDPTEFLEVREFPFAEVLRMTVEGEITDSMTVAAILLAALRRSS